MVGLLSMWLAVSWKTGRFLQVATPQVFTTWQARFARAVSLSAVARPDPQPLAVDVIRPHKSGAFTPPVSTWWATAISRIRLATRSIQRRPNEPQHKIIDLADCPSLCFYPGVVHGGLISTIFDEVFAEACSPAYTKYLNTTYHNLLPPGSLIRVQFRTTKIEGRKRWMAGEIESISPGTNGRRKVFAEADALFIMSHASSDPNTHLKRSRRLDNIAASQLDQDHPSDQRNTAFGSLSVLGLLGTSRREAPYGIAMMSEFFGLMEDYDLRKSC